MESTSDQVPLINKKEEEEEQKENIKKEKNHRSLKKRKLNHFNEDNFLPNPVYEIFLKIIYPLTISMDKSIVIGVFKNLDFAPGILLLHNSKCVVFTVQGWNSFNKHMTLVECYLLNKVHGKKTAIRLNDSNVEIDNVRIRANHGIRFRDLTKFDSKVVLNSKEFSIMLELTPAINRYLDQLSFCGPVIKDYLMETTLKQPNMHLIYGPVDTSIYNRLPQEINLYRTMIMIENEKLESDGEELLDGGEEIVKQEEENDEQSEQEISDNLIN